MDYRRQIDIEFPSSVHPPKLDEHQLDAGSCGVIDARVVHQDDDVARICRLGILRDVCAYTKRNTSVLLAPVIALVAAIDDDGPHRGDVHAPLLEVLDPLTPSPAELGAFIEFHLISGLGLWTWPLSVVGFDTIDGYNGPRRYERRFWDSMADDIYFKGPNTRRLLGLAPP